MKPKTALRQFLALAGTSLMAISSAFAQTTYTWTQTGNGNQDWTSSGNWAISPGGSFVSGSGNELMFFAGTSGVANQLAAGASQVVTNVPASLSMNRLTLNGIGPNSDLGSSITIGTSASTWTLGDGTTSTVNLNSTLGGGGANRDLRYTIGANLTLVGDASGITTFTGASTSGYGAIFSGNIGEGVAGKGVTKSLGSLLVFSGTNSYTGTTAITGGVLRLASASALPGGIGTTGGTSALTLNGGVLELGAGDFSRGLGAGSSQFRITGGTSGFSAYGGPRVVTVGGDSSFELQWGSTHFAPSTLVLNQAYGFNALVPPYLNGSIELRNKIDLNGTTRTVQVGANYALISGDIRTSTGSAIGLTKSGGGTLVLTGNNTYNGTTTISAGALSISTINNIGGSGASNLAMTGGTLQIRGTTLTSLSDLDSTVTFSNTAKGFDIQHATNTFTVDQVISGTGTGSTLTKSGVGTLILNQNNTFAGATGLNSGRLVLDYTTNNGSKLSDTAGLTLSGGALVLKGGVGAGANHAEVIASSGTTITGNTSNSISRDGGNSTISLGAIATSIGSSLSISEANLATTTSGNTNGILAAGRITVGNHFASNDGSNSIVAYGAYTAATTAGGGNSALVHELAGGGTMAANLATYSLRIVNDADSNVLNLGANRINLTNNTTLLYAGGFNHQYTVNGTGFITSASGNQPFLINTYDGTILTLNVRTSQNGAAVSKAGKGTLVMGADNSSGTSMSTFYAQEGVTRLTNGNALGTAVAGTVVQGGAALELAGGIAVGAEPLSLNGAGISNAGALRNQSGSNSFAGLITIGASGARINADASTSLALTGGIVTTLTQDVTFGGAGNTTVSTTAITGSGSVIKDGAGTLTLSAANTFTGATTVSAGTLYVTGALSNSAVTVEANGTIGSNGIAGTLGSGLTIAASGNLDLTGATIAANSTGILGLTGGSLALGNLTFQDIVGWDWLNAAAGTYELIDGTFSVDFGSTAFLSEGTAYDFGNGKKGYFTSGSLNAVIVAIPEPRAALLGAIGLIALLRRRR